MRAHLQDQRAKGGGVGFTRELCWFQSCEGHIHVPGSIFCWSLDYMQDFVDWRSGSLARSIQAGWLRRLDAARSNVFQLREVYRLGDLAVEGVFTRLRVRLAKFSNTERSDCDVVGS